MVSRCKALFSVYFIGIAFILMYYTIGNPKGFLLSAYMKSFLIQLNLCSSSRHSLSLPFPIYRYAQKKSSLVL